MEPFHALSLDKPEYVRILKVSTPEWVSLHQNRVCHPSQNSLMVRSCSLQGSPDAAPPCV